MKKEGDQHSGNPDQLRDKISGLESEVIRSRESVAALSKQLSEYEDIFETIKEGIAYTTLSGKVLSVNKALEKILEQESDKLVGKNILTLAGEMLGEYDFKLVLPILEMLIKGKPVKPFQVRFRNKILEVSVNINLTTRKLSGTIRDITEEKKISEALSVSEMRLNRAELASKSGNWELHLDTGVMYGSEGALKLYGLTRSSLLYSQVRDIPLPEFRPMMDKALNDLISGGEPYDIEYSIKNQSTGEIIDLQSISHFDKEKRILFGSIQDITARKKLERETNKKNRDLSRLLDISMDLLETFETKTIYRKILEGSSSLIGLDTAALYILNGEELFLEATIPPLPDEFPDEFRKAVLTNHTRIKKAVQSRTTIIEENLQEADLSEQEGIIVKSRGLISALYIPLMAQKRVVGVMILGAVREKHIFTRSEIDLSRTLSTIASLTLENSFLFEKLVKAKDKAEESDQLKTAFLHNISHEIRTPLNAIVGFSGFLQQPDLAEKDRKEYISIINQSNNQLLSIISDILNISQIETGRIALKESVFDVPLLVNTLYQKFLPEITGKGLEFRLNPQAGYNNGKSSLLADEGKLVQILSNLLKNAVKFTEQGFIEMDYGLKDGTWTFTVTDTGIGIDPSEHERIFDRFYQVNINGTSVFGGTGLGLSISRAFALLMSGNLGLESEFGKGSAFILSIPHRMPFELHKVLEKSPSLNSEPERRKSTILVAEDEDSNFYLINIILRSLNFNIIRALNGKEAVDLCRTMKPDLILMDLKMPVLDGIGATMEILKIKPELKIVAQSAYAQSADKEKAFNAGCVDYITKPFNKETLLGVIDKYLI